MIVKRIWVARTPGDDIGLLLVPCVVSITIATTKKPVRHLGFRAWARELGHVDLEAQTKIPNQ